MSASDEITEALGDRYVELHVETEPVATPEVDGAVLLDDLAAIVTYERRDFCRYVAKPRDQLDN
jgi:hypothetical protein